MVNFGGESGEKLRQFVSRLETLEEEKKAASEYLSDCFKEAKSSGFDVSVLKQILKIRKADRQKLAEQQEILELYEHALGMVD
jgi:uncharacterized protein (UPF0335 family)